MIIVSGYEVEMMISHPLLGGVNWVYTPEGHSITHKTGKQPNLDSLGLVKRF
jgi:hypothetical protein